MASNVTVRWVGEGVVRSGDLGVLPGAFVGPVWIDMTDPDAEDFESVGRRFPLPPLAVEDCLHFPQRPKLDVYPDLTFAIWLTPRMSDSRELQSRELDIFLGEEFLITAHHDGFEAIDRVAAHADEYLKRGVEWTMHAILDLAVDSIFPLVEAIADDLEDLEDVMLENAHPEQLSRLFAAKRTLVGLHKIVGPERDVVRALARLEAFVEPDAYMYFQDVGDHLARVEDSIDTYREVANGTMDIYLSAQGNRMNQIMKQLTVVATIFMPLTLISGIYGMNLLKGMWPRPDATWAFGVIIAGMIVIAVWMMVFFRRKNWW